jgi:polyisoprenyl-phosphate glycosyltransferase
LFARSKEAKVALVDIDLRMTSGGPTYSFVIPVYNEEGSLPELYGRLMQLLARLDGDSEVIFVDDGSTDSSWEVVSSLHLADLRFKGIRLSRNFGKEAAMTAGMDLVEGQAVIVMDADLQDPPEVVLEMAQRWRDGYEIVYGYREDRDCDSWFKRTTARLFYKGLNCLSDTKMPDDVGDFRLIDRRALEAFRSMREGNRYVRGMYSWVGFRQVGVPFRRASRHAGTTKFPVKRLIQLATDSVVGFSRVPLKLALKVGGLLALGSLLAGVAAASAAVLGGASVAGWVVVLLAVCFLGGLQIVFLGILGQYLGRTYEESLGRPLYVVSQLHGVRTPLQPIPRAVIAQPPTLAHILGEPALEDRFAAPSPESHTSGPSVYSKQTGGEESP